MTYRDELRAALDRAEAAERRLDSVCAVHPQAPVAAACALCEKRLCTACVMMSIAGTFCGPCFVKERQRELRRRLVVVTAGVGAIVASVLGAIWFWRPAHVIQPPSVVFPPPSPEERLLMLRARLAERLGREPCNRPVALELAEANNRAQEFAATVELTEGFLARCGAFPRLLWPAYEARQERGEWEQAASVAGQLIVSQPYDMDFWWWRGDSLAAAERIEEASVDYRQAIALGANRVAPWRLAEIAEKIERPCEGAFAIAWSSESDEDADGAVHEQSENLRKQLWSTGRCDELKGTGMTEIQLDTPEDLGVQNVVTVAGKPGRFQLDYQSGLTLVSRKLATKAGIHPTREASIWVYHMGRIIPAQLGRAPSMSLGDAKAPQVDVAITDELTGYDGVIGLSFLWRFRNVKWDDGRIGLDSR